MATTTNTTYLITGANRGIGLGLTTSLLKRDNTTIIAGVRDPSHPTSKALSKLSTGSNSSIFIVRIDSASETSAFYAVGEIKEHGITHIDTVIANAGIGDHASKVIDTPPEELRNHFQVNSIGPVVLFQATWPLLQKSARPKFVAISTILGAIGGMEHLPMTKTAYGASKAALNFIVKRMHLDHVDLIAFPIHPGWVATDMGNVGAKQIGMEAAPMSLEESVNGVLQVIDTATREKTSGTFQSVTEWPYGW